jgi:hypothetical protein
MARLFLQTTNIPFAGEKYGLTFLWVHSLAHSQGKHYLSLHHKDGLNFP